MKISQIAILIICFQQVIAQKIVTSKQNSKTIYSIGQEEVNKFNELNTYFAKHESTRKQYSRYLNFKYTAKNLAYTGLFSFAIGTVLFVTQAGDCCTDQQKLGIYFLFASLPLEFSSLTIAIIAKSKQKKIINTYNEIIDASVDNSKSTKLEGIISLHKIGLQLNF